MSYTEATVRRTSETTHIIWQGYAEDSAGEQALSIKEYTGSIEIEQDGDSILINNETLKGLEKLFRSIRAKNLL